jgi:hypothetical protein
MQAVMGEVTRAFGQVFGLTPRSLEATQLAGAALEPGDSAAPAPLRSA